MDRTWTVEGMTCAHCTAAVEEEVGAVPGVTAVSADLATGALVVSGDAEEAAVRAAVDEAGYAVR